jgi:hypothetical protein
MKSSTQSKLIGPCWLLLLAFVLVGCQTVVPNIKDSTQLSGESIRDKSIVFGRFQWTDKGAENKISYRIFTMSLTFHLRRLGDQAAMTAETDEKGEFTWALEKGTYAIDKIFYRDPKSEGYFVFPRVAFWVAKNGEAYYIGTLRAESEAMRNTIGGSPGQIKFTRVDQADTDIRAFQEKFATWSSTIHKSLMVPHFIINR